SRAFYLPLPPLPASSLFPYTTLFRSSACSYFFVRCEGNADWAMWNLFFVDTFDHCHDFRNAGLVIRSEDGCAVCRDQSTAFQVRDRKSTRLNSSHVSISYAVFCLKKK